jgi:hypothetical protein
MLEEAILNLAQAAAALRERHPSDPEVHAACTLLETWSRRHAADLAPFGDSYGRKNKAEGKRLRRALLTSRKSKGLGLVRDLHDLWVMAHGVKATVTVLTQAARALRDQPFESLLSGIDFENDRQIAWILTKLKHSAPQALVVPS